MYQVKAAVSICSKGFAAATKKLLMEEFWTWVRIKTRGYEDDILWVKRGYPVITKRCKGFEIMLWKF